MLFRSDLEESGELWFLRAYFSHLKNPVLFDVGANIGKYTTAALQYCPSAKAHCFEPHPVTFSKLKEACQQNGVQLHNFGLGDRSHEATIYDHDWLESSGHASLYRDVIEKLHGRGSKSFPVKIRKFDEVVAELGVAQIDLLKVDTEGHDLFVFRGAEETIRRGMIKAIQWEFNEMNVVSRTFFKDFWELLKDYRFFRLLRGGKFLPITEYTPRFCEIFAFQNIVCLHKDLKV